MSNTVATSQNRVLRGGGHRLAISDLRYAKWEGIEWVTCLSVADVPVAIDMATKPTFIAMGLTLLYDYSTGDFIPDDEMGKRLGLPDMVLQIEGKEVDISGLSLVDDPVVHWIWQWSWVDQEYGYARVGPVKMPKRGPCINNAIGPPWMLELNLESGRDEEI